VNRKKPKSEQRLRLAELIHSARIRKGLTVSEVARRIGVNRTTYQFYESSVTEPPLTVGLELLDLLGIDYHILLKKHSLINLPAEPPSGTTPFL